MGDDGGKSPQEGTGDVVQALQKQLPQLISVITGQYKPAAESEYSIAKEYSPKIAQLQADTFADQGKQLAKTGRELSAAEIQNAADAEAAATEGAGMRTAAAAVKAQREADPEYYAARGALKDAIGRLTDYDPNHLSKGEEESVARGLARTGSFVPSALETAKGALAFGDALNQRRATANSSIATAANATQALRGGVDAAGLTGRRTVLPNTGTPQYTGIVTPGVNMANATAGNLQNTATQAMNINMQKEKSDWEKYMAGLGAVNGTIGTIGSVVGMAAGVCWVARAVYGEADPRWIVFRGWLGSEAPIWLFNLYNRHGQEFAEVVKRSPLLRRCVKFLMDRVVNPRMTSKDVYAKF